MNRLPLIPRDFPPPPVPASWWEWIAAPGIVLGIIAGCNW